MLRTTFIIKCALALLCLLFIGCADDIPELLSESDIEGMLAEVSKLEILLPGGENFIDFGESRAAKVVKVKNTRTVTLNWKVEKVDKKKWLEISPISGKVNAGEEQSVALKIITEELEGLEGEQIETITFTNDDVPDDEKTVAVKIKIVVAEPSPTQIRPKDGMKMRLIPAGEFSMGDHHDAGGDAEKPVHTVYLDDYYIDETEVTNEQYCAFLNDYGKNVDADGHELLKLEWSQIEKVGNTYKPKSGYEKHPVGAVTWYGAAAYAQWAGAGLPTEAQWEKAARGGLVGKKYPWGDTITHDDANYWGTGGKDKWDETSPVGSFPANRYGLFDMDGNVWEWCADGYGSGYYSKSPKNNPTGPGTPILFVGDDFTNVNSPRVVRGGSWLNGHPDNLRCAYRYNGTPAAVDSHLGFRCRVPAED